LKIIYVVLSGNGSIVHAAVMRRCGVVWSASVYGLVRKGVK